MNLLSFSALHTLETRDKSALINVIPWLKHCKDDLAHSKAFLYAFTSSIAKHCVDLVIADDLFSLLFDSYLLAGRVFKLKAHLSSNFSSKHLFSAVFHD